MKKFLLTTITALSIGSITHADGPADDGAAAKPGGVQASQKPNILFIAVDDLKPALGCYGDQIAKTPHIDKLAASGTVFTNAHCNQAVCGPSRASLMTGLRPDRTKVHDLKTKIRKAAPFAVTLPEHLKANGYMTLGVGKIYDPRSVDKGEDTPSWSQGYPKTWHLDYSESHGQPVQGAYQSKKIREFVKELKAQGISGYGPIQKKLKEKGMNFVTESASVPDNAYTDGAIADRGIDYIKRMAKSDQPHFIAIGFKKPHLPFIAPQKYWNMYDRNHFKLAKFIQAPDGAPTYAMHDSNEIRTYGGIPESGPFPEKLQRELIHGYYACTSYIDAQIGRIMVALRDSGEADNTIVILWGDHGWHLGDHGLWCKHSNYEQATRSPLIIAGPRVKAKHTSTAPTEFVDIYPSLCELAGVKPVKNLDGVSFVPVVTGKKHNVRTAAVSQFGRGKRMGYTLRTEHFRYVVWVKNFDKNNPPSALTDRIDAEELYDYQTDPLETKSLASDPAHADTLKSLREAANSFLAEQAKRIAKQPNK